MTTYERLSPVDAMFLDIEDACAHMHVGGVLVFEGPPPLHDELVAHVRSRLARVPRYRQRLASVPLHLGRPVWVDDPGLDLGWHVPRAVVPSPGGADGLRKLAAWYLGEPLDRARPLWRLALAEHGGDRTFALLSKTHHCLLDGIAGVDFLEAITDPVPDAPAREEPRWTARPAPGALALVADALRDRIATPLRLAREALVPGTEGRRVLRDLVAGAAPLAELAVSWPARPWALEERTGADRAWETLSVELAAVKEVRARLGGTVNDVILAVVAGALRVALEGRRAPIPGELRAFVPVNVRPPEARGTYGNQVALWLCPLPVGEADPVLRLRRTVEATCRLKARRQAVGVLAFEHLGELVPAAVAAEAMRIVLAMHFFNLVVSNIPGPQTPRWLLGRRLLSCHPAIPLARGQGLAVGVVSYAGHVDMGLLGGVDLAPELEAIARAVPGALDELVRAARAVRPAQRAPRRVAPAGTAAVPP